MTEFSQGLEELDAELRDICKRLDHCAGRIRDLPLEPTKEMIYKIGTALAQIYDIYDAIYEHRPDLKPEWLDSPHRLQ